MIQTVRTSSTVLEMVNGKKKRIFVGIPANQNIKSKIVTWQNKFLKNFIVRKVLPDNLHITLIPPWYSNEVEREAETIRALNDLPKAFEIKFERVEIGPKGAKPRLIWLHAETPPQLLSLQGALSDAFQNKEKRPHVAHMTIARWNPKKTRIKRQIFPKIDWEMKVDKICLFESKLTLKGAEYKVLSDITL